MVIPQLTYYKKGPFWGSFIFLSDGSSVVRLLTEKRLIGSCCLMKDSSLPHGAIPLFSERIEQKQAKHYLNKGMTLSL